MKRLLVAFLFATVSFVSSIAQPMETPVCYAFSEGSVSTLKYKFSYENEKYFIDLRLIGHGNTFKAGDQVLFVTHDGAKYTYVIPEIEEAPEYYLVEMNLYEGTYRDSVEYRTAALVAAKEKAAVKAKAALQQTAERKQLEKQL